MAATAENLSVVAGKDVKVRRRNGDIVAFDQAKIATALKKAFLDSEADISGSQSVGQVVNDLAARAARGATRALSPGQAVEIETIQDHVELELMRAGWHRVARDYVLFRDARASERKASAAADASETQADATMVVLADGRRTPAAPIYEHSVASACAGLADVDPAEVIKHIERNIFDGLSFDELCVAETLAARQLVEADPSYTYVAARLLANQIHNTALSHLGCVIDLPVTREAMADFYPTYFTQYIEHGIQKEQLDPHLAGFDLDRLGRAIEPERDDAFTYLGLKTFNDRYLIHDGGVIFETPQALFMRVAMGLALSENEGEQTDYAVQFYQLLSSFCFMDSTPTLFNAGTLHPQCSSCYLTTIPDDLDGIFMGVRDNAMLQKFAGGLGNDWTPVRAMGAHIKGTNGKSQGVIPFLKVANDTAVSVNQGGKRKGAVCAYLETWHKDIEEFIDLRKNTGDDRRRTHDMNTANWIPDLFVKRVLDDASWTLFSPNDVPELHDLYGHAFQAAYEAYEAKVAAGEITNAKTVSAKTLWRKMLSMLFETGHPWFTFKDPCNLRSPQQHDGIVHSSNLCTEITLNTKAQEEIAVCNLGSVNLAAHIKPNADGKKALSVAKLSHTIRTAMRMLDNVIGYNYYSVETARDANQRHRPVGLGIMGFQDALHALEYPYDSDDAVAFADASMEAVSFYAIEASADLARERGQYESFEGSLWSQGVLPIDSIDRLADERGAEHLDMDRSTQFDWDTLRDKVRGGMRNSNCMAIAPTATIANIVGTSQSIEPTYQNLYVKSNLSGEFTVVNPYLASDLKDLGLWDSAMVHDLKAYDGSVQAIDRIPDHLKALYKTAFEIDPYYLIEAASRRQKWIDQAQSLNLYMAAPSGKKLEELYLTAWRKGLKTTYYLRTMGATHTEKSTIEDRRLNAVGQSSGSVNAGASSNAGQLQPSTPTAPMACAIDDPDCEACQ